MLEAESACGRCGVAGGLRTRSLPSTAFGGHLVLQLWTHYRTVQQSAVRLQTLRNNGDDQNRRKRPKMYLLKDFEKFGR